MMISLAYQLWAKQSKLNKSTNDKWSIRLINYFYAKYLPMMINGSTMNDAARSFESIEDWVTGNSSGACCCDWKGNCCWPFVTTKYFPGELLCAETLLIFDANEIGIFMEKYAIKIT